MNSWIKKLKNILRFSKHFYITLFQTEVQRLRNTDDTSKRQDVSMFSILPAVNGISRAINEITLNYLRLFSDMTLTHSVRVRLLLLRHSNEHCVFITCCHRSPTSIVVNIETMSRLLSKKSQSIDIVMEVNSLKTNSIKLRMKVCHSNLISIISKHFCSEWHLKVLISESC